MFDFVLVCVCGCLCSFTSFVHSTDVCAELCYMPGPVLKAGHTVGFTGKISVLKESCDKCFKEDKTV